MKLPARGICPNLMSYEYLIPNKYYYNDRNQEKVTCRTTKRARTVIIVEWAACFNNAHKYMYRRKPMSEKDQKINTTKSELTVKN